MSATKKTAKAAGTPRRSAARRATARKATTARRTTTSRRRTTRRTSTRRPTPKIATTIGAGLATLAVAAFAGASWPVRVALVVAALVLVGGYLLVQGRRHDTAEAATEPNPVAGIEADNTTHPDTTHPDTTQPDTTQPDTTQPGALGQSPAAPHTDAALPAEPRPEDPA